MIRPLSTINRMIPVLAHNSKPITIYALTRYVLGDIGGDLHPEQTAKDFEAYLLVAPYFRNKKAFKILLDRKALLEVPENNTWTYLYNLIKVLPDSSKPTQAQQIDSNKFSLARKVSAKELKHVHKDTGKGGITRKKLSYSEKADSKTASARLAATLLSQPINKLRTENT